MSEKKSPPSAFRAYLDGLSPTSQKTMEESLDIVARFFDPAKVAATYPWQALRHEHVQALRAHLVSKYKARTINKYLAAVRGVLKAAWRLKLLSTDNYEHARDVRVAVVSDPPAGRSLTVDELRRCVGAAHCARDAALFTVHYAAGLRLFESSPLTVGSYSAETGELTIHGKRGKVRRIAINRGWRAPIERWLGEYAAVADAPMFPSRRRVGEPLSKSGVRDIIEECRVRADVAPFTSHDLRRSFITHLLDAGVDISIVQRLADHEDVNTTGHYDRRGQDAERAAIEKLKGLED